MVKTEEWDLEIGKGFHPAVYIFPEMTETEFAEFKEDIREHGLKVPIVTTPDGLILDGRHRWNACMELKIKPTYQVHAGDPWDYVISANLHRRHLNDAQRAMVAARMIEARRGGNHGNQYTKAAKGSSATLAGSHAPVTQSDAAAMVNVKSASVKRASIVNQRGTEDLKSLVDQGGLPIATAHRLTKLDEAKQVEAVDRIKKGHKVSDILAGPPPMKKVVRGKTFEKHVFSATDAQGLEGALGGMQLALSSITEINPNVTPQEAKYLVSEIGKTKTVLNKLQALLKKVE